jgi:hypothetical protein
MKVIVVLVSAQKMYNHGTRNSGVALHETVEGWKFDDFVRRSLTKSSNFHSYHD